MSEQAAKESYEVERRVMRGMDSFADLSLLPDSFYRETRNLTVNGGIHETRPGSTRYGAASFAGIAGEQHGMTFITTLQGEWCLAHIGNGLYAAIIGSGAAPTRIVDLSGVVVVVSDSNHPSRQPFVKIQLAFDTGGFRIYKILFRSSGEVKVIEYAESSASWLARGALNPVIGMVAAVGGAGPFAYIPGTYRIRICAIRIVNGVRISQSPVTGGLIPDVGYQQLSIAAGQSISIGFGLGPLGGTTHVLFQLTRVLSFVGGTSFSNNGNDPEIYYEAGTIDLNTLVGDVDPTSLTIPCQDTRNFLSIPPHYVSVFYGGIIFFVDPSKSGSRIFSSGADGFSVHSELYNPGSFIPCDEADGKIITAMEIIGPHLGVWKENKTGVVLNRNPEGDITWRDRKIGAPAQGCVAMLTEKQAAVLCHDGRVRLFDGNSYDHSLTLTDRGVEISNPIRNISERIPYDTVTFAWHREKLHLLYEYLGNRRALVLHPRENYEWTPWQDLSHLVNALAENETRWIFMDADSGFLFEQSPLDAVYLDRDKDIIQWYRHDSALWPKARRSSMVIEDCFLEGIFDMLTEAHFELDEQRVVAAGVGISPLSGIKASKNQRWFKCWPPENVELRCHSLELVLQGIGYSLHRATQYRVIEEASLGIPSVPAVEGDIFAYLPAWGAPVVFYARFEQDAEMQYDFSGHRRNLTWKSGVGGLALRTHTPSMPPYGGETIVSNGDTESGWIALGWDGMDFIGDVDGACSEDQTFEFVFAATDSLGDYMMRASGPNGTMDIDIATTGSIIARLYTNGGTPKRYSWNSPLGIVQMSGPDDPYVLQLCLFNGGDSLKAWFGKAAAALTEINMPRTDFGSDSGYVGDFRIAMESNLHISHFRRLARIRDTAEAKSFHNLIKGTL